MKFDSSAWNPHPHTSVSPKEMGVSSDSFAPSRNSYSGSAHLTTLRNFVRRSLSSASATTINGLSSGYDTEPRLRPAETCLLISIEQRDSMTFNTPNTLSTASGPIQDRSSALPAIPDYTPVPASLHRPRVHPLPDDAGTDASGEHCQEPAVQPSAQRSCAHMATTNPCSNS